MMLWEKYRKYVLDRDRSSDDVQGCHKKESTHFPL
jgi:hypothetical protein